MSEKLSVEKSEILAAQIEAIKSIIYQIDTLYLIDFTCELKRHAARYDSAAAILPNYNPVKSCLLSRQGECLNHLSEFIECLKLCQTLKDEIRHRKIIQDDIDKNFI